MWDKWVPCIKSQVLNPNDTLLFSDIFEQPWGSSTNHAWVVSFFSFTPEWRWSHLDLVIGGGVRKDRYTTYTKKGPNLSAWMVSPPSRSLRNPACPEQSGKHIICPITHVAVGWSYICIDIHVQPISYSACIFTIATTWLYMALYANKSPLCRCMIAASTYPGDIGSLEQ